MQLGQERAGFYSNDWLENLVLADIHNADEIRPEWQQHQQGDKVLGAGGAIYGESAFWPLRVYEAGKVTYLWGSIVVLPVDADTSVLIARTFTPPASPIAQTISAFTYDWMHFVMERGMLLGIKARAEQTLGADALWRALAALGWILATVIVGFILFARRRGWWWGLIPLAYALTILFFTGDFWSAMAGFLWWGIIIAGFVLWGRRWWKGLILAIVAVILTFVLADQPHTAFGIMFLLACTVVPAAILLAWSPGKPRPIVDENGRPLAGSIAEKIRVNINGVQQGMFIKSRDATNPVLLFLHGGPGMPEYFLTERYPTGLEAIFTVVWWDRRGAGLSYSPHIPRETMTIEQSIADTLAVTDYLRQRFGQEKIYLLAHSGGSFIGIQAAARAPELYHAYLGMGQMTYQIKSEQLAYAYMLEQFRANGDKSMVRSLEQAPVTLAVPLPPAYARVRDEAMHKLGVGTTRDMKSVVTGIFLPSWQFREYTLGEKINLWRGKLFSHAILWDEMIATDLTQQVTELALPVYFLHGKYDYTCSYTLAKAYFEQLKAPLKGFYTFEHSAHSPVFEEPERMSRVLKEDVLMATNGLADAKQEGTYAI